MWPLVHWEPLGDWTCMAAWDSSLGLGTLLAMALAIPDVPFRRGDLPFL